MGQTQDAVTSAVAQFYRELPFNYEQTVEQAAQTIRENNQIASAYPPLDEVLRWERPSVLDVGCGVGWFVNTVAYHYRLPVVGIDLCEPALERATAVAMRLGVDRVTQYQCLDLFEAPALAQHPLGRFGLVNSLGVLHHTYDCRRAIEAVAELVAPNGYLHLGLYHRYGRAPFLTLFQAYRDAACDPARAGEWEALEAEALRLYQELNPSVTDPTMLRSWFRDQVLHPHESQHTLEEVYGWLTACGFECCATSINRFEPIREWCALFEEEKRLETLSHQRNVKEKRYFPGFFVVLAKKPS